MRKVKMIFSILLVTVMLFALVACNTSQDSCQSHIDKNNDGKCDNCNAEIQSEEQNGNGNNGSAVVKGHKVIAEVWKQQLSIENPIQYYTNFTLEAITDGVSECFQVDGDKSRVYGVYGGSDGSTDEYVYVKIADDLYKNYEVINGKRTISYSEYNESNLFEDGFLDEYIYTPAISIPLADNFSKATFDNSTGEYVLKDAPIVLQELAGTVSGKLLFVDNKLVSIQVTYIVEEREYILKFEIGNTVINIPQPSGVTDEQGMSEVLWDEQLQSLFDDNENNISFRVVTNSSDLYQRKGYYLDIYNDKISFISNASGAGPNSQYVGDKIWHFTDTGASVYTYDFDNDTYSVETQQVTKQQVVSQFLEQTIGIKDALQYLTNPLVDMFSLARFVNPNCYQMCFGGHDCKHYEFGYFYPNGYAVSDELVCCNVWKVYLSQEGKINDITGYLRIGDGQTVELANTVEFNISCGQVRNLYLPEV